MCGAVQPRPAAAPVRPAAPPLALPVPEQMQPYAVASGTYNWRAPTAKGVTCNGDPPALCGQRHTHCLASPAPARPRAPSPRALLQSRQPSANEGLAEWHRPGKPQACGAGGASAGGDPPPLAPRPKIASRGAPTPAPTLVPRRRAPLQSLLLSANKGHTEWHRPGRPQARGAGGARAGGDTPPTTVRPHSTQRGAPAPAPTLTPHPRAPMQSLLLSAKEGRTNGRAPGTGLGGAAARARGGFGSRWLCSPAPAPSCFTTAALVSHVELRDRGFAGALNTHSLTIWLIRTAAERRGVCGLGMPRARATQAEPWSISVRQAPRVWEPLCSDVGGWGGVPGEIL
jgi:hypothetical protein